MGVSSSASLRPKELVPVEVDQMVWNLCNPDLSLPGDLVHMLFEAAFAKPDIYEYLDERRVFYAIRLPSNKVLQWEIAPLLIRPVGRPPKRPVILYDDLLVSC